MIGQRFGRLIVVASAQNKGERVAWTTLCACGQRRLRHQLVAAMASGRSRLAPIGPPKPEGK